MLRKIIFNTSFRRRVSVEEQRAQKHNRFLRGRQIAYMIYDRFQATGAYEAVLGPSALFNIHLQNDDVQDFVSKWDEVLLATSEIPRENVLEGVYKMKLQGSEKIQIVLALYNQELSRDKVTRHLRLRTMVRPHIDQMIRTRKFKALNERIETDVLVKSHNGRNARYEREKLANAFSGKQLDSVRKDSCSF